ncbi:MAG TPA: nucleoside triphosphate pyrophosphohydrolase [Firmicutes bacterium]|nr:nucleoside triphosphate pyrophosphohydrolase [Bacillota bacterium]
MGEIVIIGLGPGDPRHLTVAARAALLRRQGDLYFKTGDHPVARYCRERGAAISFLDRLTGAPATAGEAARAAGRILLTALKRQRRVSYAIPGNPLEGSDETVQYLRFRAPRQGHRIRIIPGVGGGTPPLRKLERIMTLLRSARGCPWDRRQTHLSLRGCLIEEAYEVIAAIERDDPAALEEELGDLLLQVVFHSEIAREAGRFDLERVIEGISAKLIRRHPHVFGGSRASSTGQAVDRWERVKEREKSPGAPGALRIDPGLPSLLGAYKVQQRAAALGFDWPSLEGAVAKVREEAAELKDAYRSGVAGKIEEEFGDYLFAAVNVARFLKINPELALGKALRKFMDRFAYIAEKVAVSRRPFSSYSLEELDRWWEEAKVEEKITNKAGNHRK